jgi:nitrite reductase/ring-hydroxylating ferredoxin subunit
MAWIKAASLTDLREQPLVLKHPPLQIAVFRIDEKIFAIDNRCPHEGYPLAVGTVSVDCILTCNWHNWKFRLEDGACVVGGDNVRSYATRVENGDVWIDVSPPPPDEVRRKVLNGLRAAFDERDHERICREIARLHYNGIDPREAVAAAVQWVHSRLEFGSSHAFAGTADWMALANIFRGDFEKLLVCVSEAVDHMSVDALRQPEYPFAVGEETFTRGAFLDAVEKQETSRVEAMVSKALKEERHWQDLEESFAAAALMHYNNFGHCAIYVQKTGELLDSLGMDLERYLVLPLGRRLCNSSREDLIPEFIDYADTLLLLPEVRTTGAARSTIEIPFPCNLREAFRWLEENLVNTWTGVSISNSGESMIPWHFSMMPMNVCWTTASMNPSTPSTC